jgi:PAS domain S-box-containing protein
MPTSAELTQLQFEIAMAIGNSLELHQMLKSALGTILRKLNCISATVHLLEQDANGRAALVPIYAVPRAAIHSDSSQEAFSLIPDPTDQGRWRAFIEQLPLVNKDSRGSYYHICNMAGAGILILVCRGEALAPVVLNALQPLLPKLADACRACLQNDALKEVNQEMMQANQDLIEKSRELEASQNSLLALMQEMHQAEQILQRTTLRLTLLISNLHAGILVEDENRRIVLVNEQFCRMFGIPVAPEAMIGADCTHAARDAAPLFVNPEQFINRVDKILAERRVVTQEQLILASGSVFERDYIPIYEDDHYLGHMWLYRDVSERKRMEETLSAVLNTVGEGIITVDQTSRIVMINREVERIFGYRSQELIGQTLLQLMPEHYRAAHGAGMARYIDTGIAHVLGKRLELEGLRKSGESFPMEIFINETEIGEQQLFTASVRDITRRKEYDRMRDDFVSTVSHELRTPLASVMGWTETLLGEQPGPLNELQKRFLNISYESSLRLNKLIEEILTVSRIQRGTLRLVHERFHPAAVLASTREMMDSVARRKEITIRYEENLPQHVTALGDPGRCEQVLGNLISNALKFSETGATVIVKSNQEDDQWHVQVIDQGIGIPEAEIPHLFERFYRATNASSAQIQGTGLGLYVCKAIIEGHGGQIQLSSREGEGTTASFTIPLE